MIYLVVGYFLAVVGATLEIGTSLGLGAMPRWEGDPAGSGLCSNTHAHAHAHAHTRGEPCTRIHTYVLVVDTHTCH